MQVIFFSAVSGIVGTGLGGLTAAILLKRTSENMICWMLSFAAGIMTSIVCFGLMPEAASISDPAVYISGLVLGIVVVMFLNRAVDKKTEKNDGNLKIHSTHEKLYHESEIINNSKMVQTGIITLIAIGLHNIPEGIAIGAGGSYNFNLGVLLTIMIALHNIPEGMAIAAPLLAGGVNKWKVVLLTTAAGAPTLLGGLIGVLLGNISDFSIAMSLSAASGAMLYVVFGEIIPQSVVMTKNRVAPLITLSGVIVGLIITRI